MKQSVRKYWDIGGFTSFKRVTWNRWMRGVGRVLVKSWVRKHKTRATKTRATKTRAIAWQKAIFLYNHQRY